jgi:hypothetical protein
VSDAEYDVLLDPYHLADHTESALTPQEIQGRRRGKIKGQQKVSNRRVPKNRERQESQPNTIEGSRQTRGAVRISGDKGPRPRSGATRRGDKQSDGG